MDENKLEFFKLDLIDRKVLLWLLDHTSPKAVQSWIEYIADDYKRKAISIDTVKLFRETQDEEPLN